MGKHKRRMEQYQAEQPQQKQWYTSMGFILAVAGIIILAGLFFLVTKAFGGAASTADTGTPTGNLAQLDDSGSQVIRMAVNGIEYEPSTFTVRQGVPVKFIVDGSKASGCTAYIVSRDFGFNTRLTKGENVIEFTPRQKGTFRFACGMNMVSGTITVV